MQQAGMSLTEFFWNRSSSTESASLLFLQKAFIPSASKLLVAVVILSMGYVSQSHAQTASASISTDAPGGADLPDAPSASPTPQQNPQPSIPFQTPPFSRNMTIGDKFKYLVEPEFGPRSFFSNAFEAGIFHGEPSQPLPSRMARWSRSIRAALRRQFCPQRSSRHRTLHGFCSAA